MIFSMAECRKGTRFPFVAVYKSPRDYPGKWVARLFDIGVPTARHCVRDSYEELLREIDTESMHRIPRSPEDDPVIVEAWAPVIVEVWA